MKEALLCAEKGLYSTTPNPRVGCVAVKKDLLLSAGWHKKTGAAHAEMDCFQKQPDSVFCDSTLYITLEPCSHHGRTPPCVDEIIKRKVRRVVFSSLDPNPKTSGHCIEKMKQHGICVEWGLLDNEAKNLNKGFFKRMLQKTPWVRLKTACSIDGRIGLASGESQWITNLSSRSDGHHWRAQSCALITGIGTILNDDPLFTVRHQKTERQPMLIILDTYLRTPLSSKSLQEKNRPVLLVHGDEHNANIPDFHNRSIETLYCPKKGNRIDLTFLLHHLAQKKEINEVLVEAGPTLSTQFCQERLLDEWICYIGAKTLGKNSLPLFDCSFETINECPTFQLKNHLVLDNDIRLIYQPVYS